MVGFSAAMGLVLVTGGARGFAAGVRNIRMLDNCDPATFNQAVGDGTCTSKSPGVPFPVFISQLMHSGQAGAWRFMPDPVYLRDGEQFIATNYGGEDHTFTEVAEYGGGFVPELNEILGLSPTPECLAMVPTLPNGIVEQGQSTSPEDAEPGVHHYMCCIHPWMHADIVVH